MISIYKPFGKKHFFELDVLRRMPYGNHFSIGFNFSASRRHFEIMLNPTFFLLRFDMNWGGDHKGFSFLLQSFSMNILETSFYNTEHED